MTTDIEPPLTRAEINKRNAARSTGPRTHAGKRRVRFNALKHGMRAKTLVLPGEDEDAYRARHDAWTADLKPQDDIDRFLVDRAVHASWMLDRAGRAIEARRQAARFADADRLAALTEEVADLGGRLIREPVAPLPVDPRLMAELGLPVPEPDTDDDPARIVIRLEATAMGCAWLLERWDELRQLLDDDLPWQPHDRLKAVRMLGRQPLDAVDDRRVMRIYLDGWDLRRRGGDRPIDRAEPPLASDPQEDLRWLREELIRHERERSTGPFDELVAGLAATERAAYLKRLTAREPRRGRDGSPAAARAGLLALIAGEEERLEAALAGHLEREEAEAIAAESFDGSDWGERVRRYEQSNDRLLLRLVQALRKRQPGAEGATSPGGRAAVRAESDPPRIMEDHVPAAIEWSEPEVSDGAATIAEGVGLSASPPAAEARDEAPAVMAPTSPDRTEPGPAGDPEPEPADPAPIATIGETIPAPIDRGAPAPSGRGGRLAAAVRRLAGSVLALFALADADQLPAASAQSLLPPTAAGPGPGPSGAPAAARWLCSSRPPGEADGGPHRLAPAPTSSFP